VGDRPSTEPRLLVIGASAPHFNPGMQLVDLAFDAVVRRHDIRADIQRGVLYTPAELHAAGRGGSPNNYGLPIDYRALGADGVDSESADAVVFWGDFLHSRHYRRSVTQLLSWCRGLSDGEALEHVDRHLYLSRSPAKVLERTLIFGEALLSEEIGSAADDDYEHNLRRLFSGGAGIWMRDALSAQRAADYASDPGIRRSGVDCALLLSAEDCAAIAAPARRPRGGAGIFLGRTPDDAALQLDFSRAVCARLGLRAEWIPWFTPEPSMSRQVCQELWPELGFPDAADDLGAALRSLLDCEMVITDAYHVSLMAWSNGIPAVCIGRGASRSTTSIADKKKEIFFQEVGAQRFYVFSEWLPAIVGRGAGAADRFQQPDVVPPSTEAIAEAIAAGAATVHRRIAARRAAAELSFVAALRDLLAGVTPPAPLAVQQNV
jgi:hypothetical protein